MLVTEDEWARAMAVRTTYFALVRDGAFAVAEDVLLEAGETVTNMHAYRDSVHCGAIVVDESFDTPLYVRWQIDTGSRKGGQRGSSAFRWSPHVEIVMGSGDAYRRIRVFDVHHGARQMPDRDTANVNAAAAAWAVAKVMRSMPRDASETQIREAVSEVLRGEYVVPRELFQN